jgi:hypothetical protein
MKARLRRSILGALVLAGVLATTPAPAAAAVRCDIDYHRIRHHPHVVIRYARFIVRTSSYVGAVGIWEDRSGDRVRVAVERAEGKAIKVRSDVHRGEYELIRCQVL